MHRRRGKAPKVPGRKRSGEPRGFATGGAKPATGARAATGAGQAIGNKPDPRGRHPRTMSGPELPHEGVPRSRQPADGGGSRRRPREGAVVPPELLIENALAKPARELKVENALAKPAPEVPAVTRRSRPGAVTVLVTGFEPFRGETVNPSWQACAALPATIGKARIETLEVPCEFRAAIEAVAGAIEVHRPAVVLCVGQAQGRAAVSVERVALNVDDARLPDNAGRSPIDEPIAANGPAAYFATVPIKAMVAAIRAGGIPAEVSNTAGTYVCNHLMYGVLHYLAAHGGETRAGFIHVPCSDAQAVGKPGTASMAVAAMARALAAAIEAAVSRTDDLKVSEGKAQ